MILVVSQQGQDLKLLTQKRSGVEFIKYLETQPSLKNYVEKGVSSELKNALNRCVSKLESFRKKHMQIVVHYILDQANDDEEVIGTGGTEFVNFLTKTKSETSGSLIL